MLQKDRCFSDGLPQLNADATANDHDIHDIQDMLQSEQHGLLLFSTCDDVSFEFIPGIDSGI